MTAVNYNFYLKENDNHGYFREDCEKEYPKECSRIVLDYIFQDMKFSQCEYSRKF